MHRHRIRQVPRNHAGLAVAERADAVFEADALDATREIGGPADPIHRIAADFGNRRQFAWRQIGVPAKAFENAEGEFRISVCQLRAEGIGAFGQQGLALIFDPEARTECPAAIADIEVGVIEDMRARMLDIGCAPARPWQAVIIAFGRAVFSAQRDQIEILLVGHMRLQPFGGLSGIAGRPAAAVDFAQNIFGHRTVVFDLDVLEHLVVKTEFLGEAVDDLVIVFGFKDRIDHFLAPLDRAVRGGTRSGCFELCADRQQIGAVLALAVNGKGGRMRIAHHQQFEPLDALGHFRHTGHGVTAMAHDEHGFDIVSLVDIIGRHADGIEPAGRWNTRGFHVLFACARWSSGLGRNFVETRLQIVILDFPNARPMLPCPFDQPVIERQIGDIETHIGGALHIAVTTEDVGAGALRSDIAGGQQQGAESAHIGGADGLLRRAHAPDQSGRLLRGKGLGHALELLARYAGDPLNLFGCPFRNFLANLVHAVNALGDKVFVFPSIGENMVQHAPDDRNIGARTHAHILGCMGGGAGKTRVDHKQVGAVDLLARQHMLQRHRMRFRRIAAHDDDGLGVADVVIGIGLGAVAPCIGHTCHGGGVADTGLMVDRIRAPERAELTEQIGSFVRHFGRAKHEHRIRAGFVADFDHLARDFADCGFP